MRTLGGGGEEGISGGGGISLQQLFKEAEVSIRC